MAEYPNVDCTHHPGPPEPGYVVCLHVLQGVEVGHFETASETSIGTVVCAGCYAQRHNAKYNEENLSLVCVHCAREHGLLLKVC
jgi:hypothetical protein